MYSGVIPVYEFSIVPNLLGNLWCHPATPFSLFEYGNESAQSAIIETPGISVKVD
jgi:hypothetical protein